MAMTYNLLVVLITAHDVGNRHICLTPHIFNCLQAHHNTIQLIFIPSITTCFMTYATICAKKNLSVTVIIENVFSEYQYYNEDLFCHYALAKKKPRDPQMYFIFYYYPIIHNPYDKYRCCFSKALFSQIKCVPYCVYIVLREVVLLLLIYVS